MNKIKQSGFLLELPNNIDVDYVKTLLGLIDKYNLGLNNFYL